MSIKADMKAAREEKDRKIVETMLRVEREMEEQRKRKMAEFIAACCEEDEGYRVRSTDLYKRFVEWHGPRAWSHQKFGGEMVLRYLRKISEGRTFYEGLRLKDVDAKTNL